jgi:membrane associated rhomboid family serine protease
MIPVGDSVRSRSFPYVNVAIIAANILVFLYELTLDATPSIFGGLTELDRFYFEWGTLPGCLGDTFGFAPDVRPDRLAAVCAVQDNTVATPFTSMFIHGGWLHLLGNMLFLWVFGDNVEDAMGHTRYAAFYIVAGLAATAAHTGVAYTAVGEDVLIPAIGASGAIAGVLGAYLVLFPRALVSTIIPIFLFFWIPVDLPAVLLIGLWFVIQLFNGVAALGAEVVGAGGGVAWFAHIGGFVSGLVLVKLFVLGRRVPPARRVIRPRGWE